MALRAYLWRPILNKRRPELDRLSTIQEWETLTTEELDQLQKNRLQSLLDHAYKHVPYYQEVFDEKPSAKRMADLPFLDKSILQNKFEDLKSNDLDSRDWSLNSSSGSTGQPASFIQDSNYQVTNAAVQHLFDRWGGRELSEPKIKLWGSEEDLLGDLSLKTRIGRWLRNVTWINAYTLTDANAKEAVKTINEEKPVTIHAYVEAAAYLAEFIEREGISVHSPKSVMVTAGTLRPEMREQIERVFDCRVQNRYGSREFGTVASECPHQNGLHYCPAIHYVEIIDPETLEPVSPGETGEIVLTSLTNYAMPLIRYRIGDVGSIQTESCSCGREWPMLDQIKGRMTDHFVDGNGNLVFPAALRKSLHDLDWVNQYQIHQTDRDRVVFRLVTDQEPPQSDIDAITERAKLILGDGTEVEYEFPQKIERLDSGKYRHSISDVV